MTQKSFHAKHGLTVNNSLIVNGTSGNVSVQINTTDAIQIPSGNTGQRPANTADGMLRFNTESDNFEVYMNGNWINAIADVATLQSAIDAKLPKAGGTLTGNVTYQANQYSSQSNTAGVQVFELGTENANNVGLRLMRYGTTHASFPGLTTIQHHANGVTVSQIQMWSNGMVNIISANAVTVNSNMIWHAGNDGDASGLDADKWKGASYTVSTASPSGGANGDFWFQREA